MSRIGRGAAALAAFGVALLPVPDSTAAVVNVDFAASGSDATHSGADGVLSGSGTIWNGVRYDTTSSDVSDEDGAVTAVDVIPTAFFASGTDGTSTNDLQDSGLAGNGFDIADLVQGNLYGLAVYGGVSMGFGIEDASGFSAGSCTTLPTYALPGISGQDYCAFIELEAFDLGGGVSGLRISSTSGLITGFQIDGDFGSESSIPGLGPGGLTLLVLAIGRASALAMRRRGPSQ